MMGYRKITRYKDHVTNPFTQRDPAETRAIALRGMHQPALRYLLKHAAIAAVYGVGYLQKTWGTRVQHVACPEIPCNSRGLAC
jgi:hypothetical protein